MDDSTDQIELRWRTPGGRLNAHSFRNSVGRALGSVARDMDRGWIFNDVASQSGQGAVAPVRFVTGGNSSGTFASIVVVGTESCLRLSTQLPSILAAMRTIPELAGHADVRFDRAWWRRSEHPNPFRISTLVLNRVKGDRARYDELRKDPDQLAPFVSEAVASGLDRMALRIGLAAPGLRPEDVSVVSIGTLSAQPVGTSGRGMRSRLTQAVVSMPIRLQGDWRVGGLVTYGNGLVAETAKERHWRDASAPAVPFPAYPRQAA